MARPSRATLSDVASRAGVSLPTVSKVLNGHTDISTATRARIQEVLEEVGYVRRPQRGTVSPTSIEVMVDQIATPYASEILAGLALASEPADVDLVVGRFRRGAPDNAWLSPGDWAKRLSHRGRTGAIVLTAQLGPDHLSGLDQEHLPIVVIDPLEITTSEVPSVGATNFAGGYAAAEHLIALGHRNVGFIGGRKESTAARARVHGFRAACDSYDVRIDERFVEYAAFDFDSGRQVAGRWLATPDRPTAIISASDPQAFGVISAAAELSVHVPTELSVVGFDDTHIAEWSVPGLTTVRLPLQDMGRMALKTVLDLAAGTELYSRHVELATELIVRSSTASPRAPHRR